MAMDVRTQVRQALSRLRPRVVASGYAREAAVLMPIFERDGAPHFLLTLRTEEVETHKGQISFPGGMRHGHEDLEQTALRETSEEIGLEPHRIELLGRYHDYISSTDYRVTPYAGYVTEPFNLAPQPSEVAAVIEVPFHVFMDAARLRVERMILRGKPADVYFYAYERHQIWGLTARIIHDFLEELAPAGRL
jgi:8-oxo-dGTP pyrophosphatase MutT (NUDIX family)